MLLVTYFRIRIVSAADVGGNENTAESVKINRQWQPPASPLSKFSHSDFSLRQTPSEN